MSEDLFAAAIAALICVGCWGLMAVPLGFAAHARMRAVERADGRRAVPANETPLLWYAVSAIAWPFALGFAIVGLAKRDWARAGRDATIILLGHFTVYVVGSVLISVSTAEGGAGLLPIVVLACVIVAVGSFAASAFAWRWSGLRAERIARAPSEEAPMGPVRYAIYAGSFLLWPGGLIATAVMNAPHDVHVGKVAFRCSLATLLSTALLVCVGLPFLVPWLDRLPR